ADVGSPGDDAAVAEKRETVVRAERRLCSTGQRPRVLDVAYADRMERGGPSLSVAEVARIAGTPERDLPVVEDDAADLAQTVGESDEPARSQLCISMAVDTEDGSERGSEGWFGRSTLTSRRTTAP